MCWYQSSSQLITGFGFSPIGSGGQWWHIVAVSEQGYRWSDVTWRSRWRFLACFHLSNDGTGLCFVFGKLFKCKMSIAHEFFGLQIIRDHLARHIYLSQALLLDRQLEKEFWVLWAEKTWLAMTWISWFIFSRAKFPQRFSFFPDKRHIFLRPPLFFSTWHFKVSCKSCNEQQRLGYAPPVY